ncbi:RNA polymerase sigma-B factor [Pseudonocardia thermophila]|uniref:RNA polymerase sigma-B factor n=1 Tax=Pseudonocardia thermophila TaxID=1848 RepID=A0A1M6SYR2_PSETH|nr:sigma-70 family RNA polymerase sigma factor [Pseudonocardia thermophila]SHK49853.1 RNA polymerase sigma-B factor [Pseudonocardia thermophila]
MPTVTRPARSADPIAANAPPTRPASEYAVLVPMLQRIAELPADSPERARLREQVIVELLPVGERLARRYASGNPWSREDLQQVASVGVIKAVDRWDADRADGSDVLAFLVPSVRGEILRWFRDRTWAMRVPRRLKELSVSIRGVTGDLTQELGRSPRPSDIARRLGVEVDEVLEALRAEAGHHTTTLDTPAGPDDAALSDRIGEDDALIGAVEDVESVRPLLDALPERERRILLLRFYGGWTQSQIAAELGISQMHVSRLLSRTLTGMRRALVEGD